MHHYKNPDKKLRKRLWAETVRIADCIHKHTCAHTKYSDIRTLLQLKLTWNNEIPSYLADIVHRCPHCVAVSFWQPARLLVLGTLSRRLNEMVRGSPVSGSAATLP